MHPFHYMPDLLKAAGNHSASVMQGTIGILHTLFLANNHQTEGGQSISVGVFPLCNQYWCGLPCVHLHPLLHSQCPVTFVFYQWLQLQRYPIKPIVSLVIRLNAFCLLPLDKLNQNPGRACSFKSLHSQNLAAQKWVEATTTLSPMFLLLCS